MFINMLGPSMLLGRETTTNRSHKCRVGRGEQAVFETHYNMKSCHAEQVQVAEPTHHKDSQMQDQCING